MGTNQMHSRVEAEIILCCARTLPDAKTIERLGLLLRYDLDWQYLTRTAVTHGVLPLLYSTLRKYFLNSVPKSTSDQLRDHFVANVGHNLLFTAELLKLLKAFKTHGIKGIPFKGPVLAASAYGDVTLRQFGDLDILVHRRDIVAAGQVIVSQGYRSNAENNHAELGHDIDPEEVAFLGPQYHTFDRSDGRSRVDLQWRITEQFFSFSLDKERLWQRLERVPVGGEMVRTFSPTDMLLILCVHGSKHRWEKLKWVCDVAELVRVHKGTLDWGKVQREASEQRTERMLGLGLVLAQELVGAELPEEISQHVQRDSRIKWVAQEIRARLFQPADRPLGEFKRVIFYIRTKDHWRESARFCLRYVSQYCQAIVTPTRIERELLPLPPSLSFVYVFVRPLRLLRKHGWIALTRITKKMEMAKRGKKNISDLPQ